MSSVSHSCEQFRRTVVPGPTYRINHPVSSALHIPTNLSENSSFTADGSFYGCKNRVIARFCQADRFNFRGGART
jgi:hypothetical protein